MSQSLGSRISAGFMPTLLSFSFMVFSSIFYIVYSKLLGLVAAVDLEKYDYTPGSGSLIRATEGTVLERIPPRVRVRKDAPIELPHVMLLIDDPKKTCVEPIAKETDGMEQGPGVEALKRLQQLLRLHAEHHPVDGLELERIVVEVFDLHQGIPGRKAGPLALRGDLLPRRAATSGSSSRPWARISCSRP